MASLFGFEGILGVDSSSRLKVLCKIGFLKTFANFTGKHLYGSLSFNKVAALQLYQKRKPDKFVFLWILRNF